MNQVPKYVVARTERGMSATSRLGRKAIASGRIDAIDNPLLHALGPDRPRASRTGQNYRAVCGASVGTVLEGQAFQTNHPRACRRCVRNIIAERNR